MKAPKTNAMRLLEKSGISFTVQRYAVEDGLIDGLSVAQKTGHAPETVYKTLMARGASGAALVFCIPVCAELNLKSAARAAGEKSVAMLPLADVLPVTGYMRGGVSPLGMKKQYPTFLHAAAADLPQILVSGGKIGLQICLAPADLQKATGAVLSEL